MEKQLYATIFSLQNFESGAAMIDLAINIFAICASLCGIGFMVSVFFMIIYLFNKKIIANWRLITGLYFPWELLGKYRQSTREEYGHTGIWFTLFIVFMSLFVLFGTVAGSLAIIRDWTN